MVNVVVAGAGVVGLHIVQAIRATQKHMVIVFSRSEQPAMMAAGIAVRVVDYSNHCELVQNLRGVHTVISTMSGPDERWVTSQGRLLVAALEAGVHRFAPSEFGCMASGCASFMPHKEVFALEMAWINSPTPVLETTLYQCGLISNIFAAPYQRNNTFNTKRGFIDFENLEAVVAGSGNEPIVVTQVEDVARFVAASLDIREGAWPEISGMVGERISINQIIKLGEEIRGCTFNVKRVSIATFEARRSPSQQSLATTSHLRAFTDGLFDVPPVLNRLFPRIRPTPLREFLTYVWRGKPLPKR